MGISSTGSIALGLSRLDLLLAGPDALMDGVTLGLLARVVLRRVLGFELRMRGFVRFAVVVTYCW